MTSKELENFTAGFSIAMLVFSLLLVINRSTKDKKLECTETPPFLVVIEYGDTLQSVALDSSIELKSTGEKIKVTMEGQISYGAREWLKLSESEKNE